MHRIIRKTANYKPNVPSTIKPQQIVGYTGDEAAAYAAKQSNVAVVAAYPITPQTIIVERFSDYVANGETDAEFVCVESEHSAMSASVGASLTGVRVFTATSSQGLALMHEVLYNAAGMRCPIVMVDADRALSAPINIHGDHSDMMGSRDCGCVQIFVEDAQETYDWVIQAFKVAENADVQLPVIVNVDGFTITHTYTDLSVLKDEDIKGFLPDRVAQEKLDPAKPMTFGGLSLPEYYYEVKRQQEEALKYSATVIDKVAEEYRQLSGREYGVIETYEMDDAEAAVLCLGSTCGTLRSIIKKMRKEGKKVGLIKLCLYRPFPKEEILAVTKNLKALAVMDRAISFGAPAGAVCNDMASALQNSGSSLKIFDAIYGLGGRDALASELEGVLNEALNVAKTGTVKEYVKFVGVRE